MKGSPWVSAADLVVEDRDAEHRGELVEEHHRPAEVRLVLFFVGDLEVVFERVLARVVHAELHEGEQDGGLADDGEPEGQVEDGGLGLDFGELLHGLAVGELEEEVGAEDADAGVLHVAGLEVLEVQRAHGVGVDHGLEREDAVGLDGGAHGADALADDGDDWVREDYRT